MKTETYIKVSFQFEGFHKRPKAPEEVKFLRDLHRHMFHVKATIEVNHDDRDLEFILVKRHLESQVQNMFEEIGEYRSCEMMASWYVQHILKHYDLGERYVSVEVSEDGENWGIVINAG